MQGVTLDVSFLMVAALFVAFCALVRRQTALALLSATYMAYVITLVWGDRIAALVRGDRITLWQVTWNLATSPVTVQLACFLVLLLTLTIFLKVRSKIAVVEAVAYGALGVCIAAVLALSIMQPDVRAQALSGSMIVGRLYLWREWLIAIPLAGVIFFGLRSSED